MKSLREQAQDIRALEMSSARLVLNSTWYLCHINWWKKWTKSTGYGLTASSSPSSAMMVGNIPQSPTKSNNGLKEWEMVNQNGEWTCTDPDIGRIENKDLLLVEQPLVIKPHQLEHVHYKLLSAPVWKELVTWYGCDIDIPRQVISRGNALSIDMYPYVFQVMVWNSSMTAPAAVEGPSTTDAGPAARPRLITVASTGQLQDLESIIRAQVNLSEFFSASYSFLRSNDNLHPPEEKDNSGPSSILQLCIRRNESSEWKSLHAVTPRTFAIHELGLDDESMYTTFPSLLVEEKNLLQNPPLFPTEVAANAWRYELKIGDWVDGLDSEGEWYESRVVALTKDSVLIHYCGWTDKWNKSFPRTCDDIAPLYTHVAKWREFKLGDMIEMAIPQESSKLPKWVLAKVSRVDEDRHQVLVTQDNTSPNYPTQRWFDFASEEICQWGTHIKKKEPQRALSLSSSSSSWGYRSHTRGRPPAAGAVGLTNLGNTCFMNSMLQCLSNCQTLSQYFLSQRHLDEINYDNPLGMKGKIASAYGQLLEDMYSTSFTTCVPQRLKSIIGEYAPQFAGYAQHDSQELMNFLLDGLHEDLNRVKSKPYTELVESNGRDRPDVDVAAEAWTQYQRRNRSHVVDSCMGQLRSHVTCPECGHESITFDPYMSLSVPLPEEKKEVKSPPRIMQLKLFWANGNVPTCFHVSVDALEGTIGHLKTSLSGYCGVPSPKLVILDVYSHRVSKVFSDDVKLEVEHLRHKSQLDVYELESDLSTHVMSSYQLSPTNQHHHRTLSFGLNMEQQPPPAAAASASSTIGWRLVNVLHQAPPAQCEEPPFSLESQSPAPLVNDNASSSFNTHDPTTNTLMKHKHRRVELFGTPLVLSFPALATNNDIHTRMWLIVLRLTKPSTGFSAQCPPYQIAVTNPSGTISHSPTSSSSFVPHDDAIFDVPSGQFSFLLEWTTHGYQEGYHEGEAERVNMHESIRRLKMVVPPPALSQNPQNLSLHECLMKFTEREQLGASDPWYCPTCRAHRRAYKKFDLWSAPQVLIVHLKRFRYNQDDVSYMSRDKIDTVVDFPISGLDMAPYIVAPEGKKAAVYDLFAVSEHSGGLGGGHYTAVAKNFNNQEWYNFNDSYVSVTTPERAISSQSYVLFYTRRTAEPSVRASEL